MGGPIDSSYGTSVKSIHMNLKKADKTLISPILMQRQRYIVANCKFYEIHKMSEGILSTLKQKGKWMIINLISGDPKYETIRNMLILLLINALSIGQFNKSYTYIYDIIEIFHTSRY